MKTKTPENAPARTVWALTPDGAIIDTSLDVIGDIVCEAPESWLLSMSHWESRKHLIAAAPELLAALTRLLAAARHCSSQLGVDFDRCWEADAEQAKSAIAKATGEVLAPATKFPTPV